ncbi:hypothetical protein SDC9_205694 [bioreactor metagenome]|uniref:Uncharacterized protein n=1 Tax=bioreactor metagenome TaxID=1076179 RepID=A0A645J2T5_9ZZZZ
MERLARLSVQQAVGYHSSDVFEYAYRLLFALYIESVDVVENVLVHVPEFGELRYGQKMSGIVPMADHAQLLSLRRKLRHHVAELKARGVCGKNSMRGAYFVKPGKKLALHLHILRTGFYNIVGIPRGFGKV